MRSFPPTIDLESSGILPRPPETIDITSRSPIQPNFYQQVMTIADIDSKMYSEAAWTSYLPFDPQHAFGDLWCNSCKRSYFSPTTITQYFARWPCDQCAGTKQLGDVVISSYCLPKTYSNMSLQEAQFEDPPEPYVRRSFEYMLCLSVLHPNYSGSSVTWADRTFGLNEIFKLNKDETHYQSVYRQFSGRANGGESHIHKYVRQLRDIWNTPLQIDMEFFAASMPYDKREWTCEEELFLVQSLEQPNGILGERQMRYPDELVNEFNERFMNKVGRVIPMTLDAKIWELRIVGKLPLPGHFTR